MQGTQMYEDEAELIPSGEEGDDASLLPNGDDGKRLCFGAPARKTGSTRPS